MLKIHLARSSALLFLCLLFLSQNTADAMSVPAIDKTFLSTRIEGGGTKPCDSDATQTWLASVQQALPGALSYRTLVSIEQANASGCILEVQLGGNGNGETETKKKIFLKQVRASNYVTAKKDWTDLRRTLLYARTEIRFYTEFVPLLNERLRSMEGNVMQHLTPTLYHANYDFSGWIPDDEVATLAAADTSIDKDALPNADQKMGVLIMECMDDTAFFQDSPLTLDQCKECLKAAANLHAAAWEQRELLELADQRLSKASFHLEVRNPKELAGMEETWQGFIVAFEKEMVEAGLPMHSIQTLGMRVAKLAKYISEEVSPMPHDPYATLIHGDYKALNVFLPTESCQKIEDCRTTEVADGTNPNQHAVMVDFASAGVGLGMSDLAMHIHHAVLPEHLVDGTEEALVRYYWEHLTSQIGGADKYPWEVAIQHYRLAVVDYFRFFTARMWKGATPEKFEAKKSNKNVNLVNRSVPAAMEFIRVVDEYMAHIEKGIEGNVQ
jgi:thiamine kinase-like enzyme